MLRLIFVTLLSTAGVLVALRSAFHGLLFYLWFAYFRPDDWSYGGTVASLRLSLWIGAYVVFRTILLLPSPKLNVQTGLIWAFFLQAIVGTFTSENPAWSAAFLEDFAKVMIMAYLLVVLVNDRSQFRLVLLVIALSLGFETAKQGWANLFRAPGAKNDNPIAFLGDNNGVALGMFMLLPILGALVATSSTRWQGLVHRFVWIGVLLRGISTYSRGGFLGGAALAVIGVIRAKHKIRAAILVGLVGVGIWNLMPEGYWSRMDTISVEEEEERDSSAAGRLHFWTVARVMAAAKPLTGVGLNGFGPSYPNYNTDQRFGGERAAHSTWFGVLGDLGYPGLILLIANLAAALWSCWQVGRLARGAPELRSLKVFADAIMAALIVYIVSGSFLSSQYAEMTWHFIGLSTALHLIAVRENRERSETQTQAVAA